MNQAKKMELSYGNCISFLALGKRRIGYKFNEVLKGRMK